jgi:von Willebrand factor type A domain
MRKWIAIAVVAAGGCRGRQPGLTLTMVDSSVRRPSNVAVYFAVDTSEGEPVPGLTAESFRIYEDGNLVSEHESKQTILNPEIAAAHYTVLLIDMSGSVTESGDLPTISAGAGAFADQVGQYQEIAVYAFDGRKEIVQLSGFSKNKEAIHGGIERLDGFQSKDPSTNLNGAVDQALVVLDRQLRRANVPLRFGTLVVFTDGTDHAGRVKAEDLYDAIDKSPHDIFVIGVGAEVNEEELGSIGRDGVVLSKNRAEIASSFEQAAARVAAATRRYYLLGYCSPARAGVHEVTIEAAVEKRVGSLSYEFNADGFRAPCDPNQPPSFSIKGRVRQ